MLRLLMRKMNPVTQANISLSVPPKPLNMLLRNIFAMERHIVKHHDIPFGASIMLVAHKDKDDG